MYLSPIGRGEPGKVTEEGADIISSPTGLTATPLPKLLFKRNMEQRVSSKTQESGFLRCRLVEAWSRLGAVTSQAELASARGWAVPAQQDWQKVRRQGMGQRSHCWWKTGNMRGQPKVTPPRGARVRLKPRLFGSHSGCVVRTLPPDRHTHQNCNCFTPQHLGRARNSQPRVSLN